MKHLTRTKSTVLASVVVGLALAGCGSNGSTASTASTLSGVVAAEAPLGGAQLTLRDSSAPPQQKTAATSGDGAFTVDVTGLQPPFMLQADWTDGAGAHLLRSVAEQAGTTHVDPLTDSALAAAATARGDGGSESDDREEHERTAADATAFLKQLRTALAPLFDLYGLGADLLHADPKALEALLKDVKFSTEDGTLLVTNRATGAVIFSGPVANLAAGTFHQENLPAGPGNVTPPPTACTYTYNAWGSCQSSGTQTRTVASSTPSGCTGTPVLSQACTSTPPPPSTCSYTYSTWGACQSSGTQTRTVLSSSPSGCTGTPVLSQSCTSTPPPPAACTYSYSVWGACQSNGTQTRTVVSSSPAGCTGTPVLSQSCTYVPPVVTCTGFTYGAWTPAVCPSSGQQTRTVTASAPAGCTGGSPVLTQTCTPPATNPVTAANVVSSCTACHGLSSNTTVFRSGGYTVSGRSAAQWLMTVNNMVGLGASLAPGTTAQNYADYLANTP